VASGDVSAVRSAVDGFPDVAVVAATASLSEASLNELSLLLPLSLRAPEETDCWSRLFKSVSDDMFSGKYVNKF
jgi:hypothetical protein